MATKRSRRAGLFKWFAEVDIYGIDYSTKPPTIKTSRYLMVRGPFWRKGLADKAAKEMAWWQTCSLLKDGVILGNEEE